MTQTKHQYNEQLVSDLVAQDPRRAAVFEQLGIDYCCGGKIPLTQACSETNLDITSVISALDEATTDTTTQRDWTTASIEELISEIQTQYHKPLSTQLERVGMLAEKVARAHGAFEASLVEAEDVVSSMIIELMQHTNEEDYAVFPVCLMLAKGEQITAENRAKIEEALQDLVDDHQKVADRFTMLRELLNDFIPPENACTSWRAYLDALERFEQELHRHVHLENHVLFPKVESVLTQAS